MQKCNNSIFKNIVKIGAKISLISLGTFFVFIFSFINIQHSFTIAFYRDFSDPNPEKLFLFRAVVTIEGKNEIKWRGNLRAWARRLEVELPISDIPGVVGWTRVYILRDLD